MCLYTLARTLTQELGGLPLALDQAGAYIEETSCGLAGYLNRYQTHRTLLLGLRGGLIEDHVQPVTTTWSLSFAQVEQQASATKLLHLCAFLAPDALPEELLIEGASTWRDLSEPVAGDAILLDQAIAALQSYSLLSRNASAHTLTIHRLVQSVVRDSLHRESQQQWMKRAIV